MSNNQYPPTSMQPPQQQYIQPNYDQPKKSGFAITALILGIVSVVLSFVPVLNIVTAIGAVIGLIFGVLSIIKGRSGKGLAIAGSSLAVIGVILTVVAYLVLAAAVVSIDEALDGEGGTSSTGTSEETLSFGDTMTYDDGLAITVSAPEAFVPGQYAAGNDQAANVTFSVTVTNGTSENLDPLMLESVSSAGVEGSSVFDSEAGLEAFGPTTAIPVGQSVTYKVGYSIADPAQVVFDISMGFSYENAIFTS